ncbi:MAG: hypothetical protein NT121_08655 [Chloroflexi bacterium]|nr:hypothetical protein [Chloroflexota bacterium]
MFQRKFNFSVIARGLTSLGLLLSSGCVPYGVVTPAPTALPPTAPSCAPNGNNFYTTNVGVIGIQNQLAATRATDIYNLYQNQNNLELARSQAINLLTYETMRWSHIEDVRMDDNNHVRVVATFFSPELIRAILLNYALLNTNPSPLSGSNLLDFSNRILSTMDSQNQYMFLIAIQPVTANKSTAPIQIRSSSFVLENNAGKRVNVENHDNFLDQTLDFLSKPHAGFIFYPMGKVNGGECQRVLDSARDTSITLFIEEAQLGADKKTVTWEIPFAPPLPVPGSIPTPNQNAALNPEDKIPLEILPELNLADTAYWRVWGQFVWGKATLDYFSLR